MPNASDQTIAQKVSNMAQAKGVCFTQSWTTNLAQAITLLADDQVEQDDTERLLVLLRQTGHLDEKTFGQWLHQHMKQRAEASHAI